MQCARREDGVDSRPIRGGGLLHPPQDHTGCLRPHEEIREILQVGKGTSKRHVQETNRDDLGENLTMRKTNPL